jgi:hypothetical protein
MFFVPEGFRAHRVESLAASNVGTSRRFWASFGHRIAAGTRDLAQSVRVLSGLGEGDERGASQANVAPLALDDGPQHPAL